MNQKTLQKLIDKYIEQNMSEKLSDYIASILEEEKIVQQDMKCYYQNYSIEDKRHVTKLKELKDTLCSIQDRCPHYEKTYYGDPSGGNNFYYECDLCAKEI